jgi:hypothetical protein
LFSSRISGNIPLLCEGINIPEESGAEAIEEFEIGRILHLKSEITNLKLDWLDNEQVLSPIGDL